MDYIYDKVNTLIKRFKTRNPFELADALNITVMFEEYDTLKGFYTLEMKNRFIVINSRISEDEQKVVCAHELAHDRLHQHLAAVTPFKEYGLIDLSSKPEREANLFAADLLIEDDDFMRLSSGYPSYQDIASQLSVPIGIADLKGQSLKKRGYEINEFDITRSDFLKSL